MLDRIKQTTTTAGTGPYALSVAASDGFRTLHSAWSVNAGFGESQSVVPYLVTAGDLWESGYGVYNGLNPGTVTRAFISGSSNNGAAVNWAVGTKIFMVAANAWSSGILGGRNNVAAVAPTAAADVTLGYRAGSLWRAGADLYVCTSATAGAAVWARVFESRWVNGLNGSVYLPQSTIETPYPRSDFSEQRLPISPVGGTNRRARSSALALTSFTTNNATGVGPLVQIGNPSAASLVGAANIRGNVVAFGNATNDAVFWNFDVDYRTSLAAPFVLQLVGAVNMSRTNVDPNLNLAAFNILIADGPNHRLRLETVGVAGIDLVWSIDVRLTECFRAF